MLEFNPSIGGGELPVGLGVVGIAIVLPSCDFFDEGVFVRDAAIEALGRKNADFGLRHIEPTAVLWRVVPFEPFGQPPCFGGGKSVIKRSLGMGVEIVLPTASGADLRLCPMSRPSAEALRGGMLQSVPLKLVARARVNGAAPTCHTCVSTRFGA